MSLHESMTQIEDLLVALHTQSREKHGKEYSPKLVARRRSSLLPDDLLTVGIVGGTGVGKSTLINSLAGEMVSLASHRRPTTKGIIPYVHEDRVEVIHRIDFIAAHLSTELGVHQRDDLRSLVIFDLPDMDSLEGGNNRVVNEVLSGLDLVIWMTSITKYADRVFHEWITNHVGGLDVRNLLFVINKIDDVSDDDGDDALVVLEERFRTAVSDSLRRCDANPDKARFFLLSASRADEPFEKFTTELLQERDEHERVRIRSSNRLKTLETNIDRVRQALCLDERRAVIDADIELVANELDSLASQPAVLGDVESALAGGAARGELARAFFDTGLRGWPLLQHVQFLLSPLTRIGTLIEAASHALRTEEKSTPSSNTNSTALGDGLARIQKERRRLRSGRDEPAIRVDYTIRDRRFTDTLTHSLLESGATALRNSASAAIIELRAASRGNHWWRRLMVYGPLLWFPLLQPLLEEILRPDASGTSLAARLAYRLVRSAGAIHLVVSAAFVLLIYAIILLALRAFASRSARQECHRLLLTTSWREDFVGRASEILAEDLHVADGLLRIEEATIDELSTHAEELSALINNQKNVG